MTKPLGIVLFVLLICCGQLTAQDLVRSVVKGAITADGDVAGAPTDFIINLDVPFDHSPGLSLAEGKTIQIILPPDFVNTDTLTTQAAFTSRTCTPGALECNTSAFIQGWPQRPIVNAVPPVTRSSPNDTGTLVYSLASEVASDGTHVFTHTALTDVGPGSAPPGPGIKQVHMILPGFRNPTTPGDYEIQVVAEVGPDGAAETGSALLTVRPTTAPSINLTSIYDPMRRNTVYQEVRPGDEIVPYNFWLWDAEGAPMLDVEIEGNTLVQNGDVVGQISISGPVGASGQMLSSPGPSTTVQEVFFGTDTGRLTAQFEAGDLLGEYVSTLQLTGGNAVQLTVNVVPEPCTSSMLLPLCVLWLAYRHRA